MTTELFECDVGDSRLTATFWSKVQVDSETGCWQWTAAQYKNGYGAYGVPTVDWPLGGGGRVRLAHRYAYERLVGVLPRKIQLDHTCHTDSCEGGWACPHRACVNPHHLNPVTARENLLRSDTPTRRNALKTHCVHGHEYTPENTYNYSGSRTCRACTLPRLKAYNARNPRRKRLDH